MRGRRTEIFAEMWERWLPRKKDIAAKGDPDKVVISEAVRPGMIPSRGSISFRAFDRHRGMGPSSNLG